MAETEGGVRDEALVSRLRYLDGTPKGSTRWIDGGWAMIVAAAAAKAAGGPESVM